MSDPAQQTKERIEKTRATVVPIILSVGVGVIGNELRKESWEMLAMAAAIAAVFLALLPKPLSLRDVVFSALVPVSAVYGWTTSQPALLLVGMLAGIFFLLEKARRPQKPGDSGGDSGGAGGDSPR